MIKTDILVLVIRSEDLLKTSSKRLSQDQFIRPCHTFSRRLEYVLNTSSRHLQDILPRCLQDIFHSLDGRRPPPPRPSLFLKGREVNFKYLTLPQRRGESEKLKEGGGCMGQGQVFLKEVGLAFFLFNFFKVYHFYI